MNISVFALTKNGAELGERLCRTIYAGDLYLPVRFKGSFNAAFLNDFRNQVGQAFGKSDGLVFIMASGIVVRSIAPFLKNKAEDPAVVVMDEKGRYVISLLSGHLGGANKLAKDIAEKFHLVIDDIKKIKTVNAAFVNSGRVIFVDEDAKRLKAIKGEVGCGKRGVDLKFYKSIPQTRRCKADVYVVITPNSQLRTPNSKSRLLLRPKNLTVGIGCDRGVTRKEVEGAYFLVLKKWDVSPLSVRNISSIDVKKDEKGLLKFAKKYNLKIDFYSKDKLADMPLPSGFSKFVMGKVGVGGVCEPAALKSAGAKRIWIKKQKIGRVTIAVARAPFIS